MQPVAAEGFLMFREDHLQGMVEALISEGPWYSQKVQGTQEFVSDQFPKEQWLQKD